MIKQKKQSGFTLLEILISISLLSIISAFVYVNINPSGRFEDSRNKQRTSAVFEIMQVLKLYQAENDNKSLNELFAIDQNKYYQIGSGSNCNDECKYPNTNLENECVDLSILVSEGYLPEIPVDPSDETASPEKTRYYLHVDTGNFLTIGACSEEQAINESPPQIIINK